MALTYLTADQANAAIEAMFPSGNCVRHVTATSDGSKTLTLDGVAASNCTDSYTITPGMTVTGTGITGTATVSSVNHTTGVVTHTGGTWSGTGAGNYTWVQAQWGSLHTASPSTTGANETTATGYTRQSVTFGQPASGVKTSTNAQTWTFTAGATITHFGFFNASGASGGTWLGGGALGSSLVVGAGQNVFAAIGAITVTVGG